MRKIITTYTTLNNNKNIIAPKQLYRSQLVTSVVSAMEDATNLCVLGSQNSTMLVAKLTKNQLQMGRRNSKYMALSKKQRNAVLLKKRTPIFFQHKARVHPLTQRVDAATGDQPRPLFITRVK